MAVKIKNGVQADLGANLPVAALLQGMSVGQLEGEVVRRLGAADGNAPAVPAPGGPGAGSDAVERAHRRAAARTALTSRQPDRWSRR